MFSVLWVIKQWPVCEYVSFDLRNLNIRYRLDFVYFTQSRFIMHGVKKNNHVDNWALGILGILYHAQESK